MGEYKKTVEIMECDYHRTLPPRRVLEHAMSAILLEMRAGGADRDRLYAQCGAVWMISHMRFFQSAPIYPEEELSFQISPRIIDGAHYLFKAKVYRGNEVVIRFDTAFIPVDKQARHVMRLSLVEPLWNSPPGTLEMADPIHRLRDVCEFHDCTYRDTVRMSDCDCNHHLTSSAYLSLACNALDFWSGPPERYMKMMQVDYASEVLPGTELRFAVGEADGAKFARGYKPDGKIAFTAKCIFD